MVTGVIGINFRAVFVPWSPAGGDDNGSTWPATPAHFKYILQGVMNNGTVFDFDFLRKFQGPEAVTCTILDYERASLMQPLVPADAEFVRSLNLFLSGSDSPAGVPLVSFSDEDVARIREGIVSIPETLAPGLVYAVAAPVGMRMA